MTRTITVLAGGIQQDINGLVSSTPNQIRDSIVSEGALFVTGPPPLSGPQLGLTGNIHYEVELYNASGTLVASAKDNLPTGPQKTWQAFCPVILVGTSGNTGDLKSTDTLWASSAMGAPNSINSGNDYIEYAVDPVNFSTGTLVIRLYGKMGNLFNGLTVWIAGWGYIFTRGGNNLAPYQSNYVPQFSTPTSNTIPIQTTLSGNGTYTLTIPFTVVDA